MVCLKNQPQQHNPHLKHFKNDSHANTSRSLLLLLLLCSLLCSHFSLLIAYHHYYLSNLQTFGKFQRMFTAIAIACMHLVFEYLLFYTALSMQIKHCINGSLICRSHFFSFSFSILYRNSHQSVANHGQISAGFI